MFQDIDISSEGGRNHVPSQASKPSSSVVSSSINLRKQLLLVMRQLSEDIESVRKLAPSTASQLQHFKPPYLAGAPRPQLSQERHHVAHAPAVDGRGVDAVAAGAGAGQALVSIECNRAAAGKFVMGCCDLMQRLWRSRARSCAVYTRTHLHA